MKQSVLFIIVIASMILSPFSVAFPHCDTMDGPVIADAKLALENNNVNHVLKWVRSGDESEIRGAFDLAVTVRRLNADARELAERYFYENLVRVHRASEGVPYAGVKPSGMPIDERITLADKAMETGKLGELENVVPAGDKAKLNDLFKKAMALKRFEVNDVKAGREYVRAYVEFFHFAEGGKEHEHGGHEGHLRMIIPVLLSIVFLSTTVVFAALYFRNRKVRT